MEYRDCSIHDLLYPLTIAVVGIIRSRCAVIYLDQPLVLIVDVLPGAFGRGVSVVVVAKGYSVRSVQLVRVRRIGIAVRVLRLPVPYPVIGPAEAAPDTR